MTVPSAGARLARLSALALATALLFAVLATSARAQTVAQAANLAALVAYPGFYADRTVVVRGRIHDLNGRLSLEDEEGHRVVLAWKSEARPEGRAEVTGVLFDLGRMKQDDPRLGGYDLTQIRGTGQEWPRPGDLFVFAETRFVPVEAGPPAPTTIRSLVLEGPQAAGRQATIVGQFRGRNLFGDLPRAPGVSRWDFVIRSAEAAIWVTGMQPHGKDFDFDPDRRIDSNRWLQVTGTVRDDRGLMVIEATRLALSQPVASEPAEAVTPPKPVAPAQAPEVLFSVPAAGEGDVSPTVTVRIQLSRSVDRASLVNRVRVGYVASVAGQAAGIESRTDLEERNDAPGGAVAVLRIRFPQPLERFRTVRVELLDGIKAPDGQLLKPWTLTFTVGGQ
jgi:hypothetical protein